MLAKEYVFDWWVLVPWLVLTIILAYGWVRSAVTCNQWMMHYGWLLKMYEAAMDRIKQDEESDG